MPADPDQLMNSCLWPLLRQRAATAAPDARFFECEGESLTYIEAAELVAHVATGLRRQGIDRGERVMILADNSVDALLAWLGANAAGIVDVPINMAARGDHLRYLLGDAGPKAVVASPARLAELAELTSDLPETAIVLGEGADELAGYSRVVPFSGLRETAAGPDEIDLWEHRTGDLATIMYSSGTTGPSKGVMLPHGYYAGFAQVYIDDHPLEASDVVYVVQPLFHIQARVAVVWTLCCEAAMALRAKFSARRFWGDIRACQATYFIYIGTMLWILYKQPEAREDSAHPARTGFGSSIPWEIREEFERRFDTALMEAYGMTEAETLASNPRADRRHGSVGRATRAVELAVVNDLDERLPAGEKGQIVFRPRYPNVVMQGYWNRPDATVEAWRNMWFHTGDLGRIDEDGYLYYLGRAKDSIRRRGENVSAWEVENALTLHPAVLEAVAFGVPSEVGEEDVAALCVVKTGDGVSHSALQAFVSRDLPAFAMPRYIEFVDSLPKTPSERIAKATVLERGLTDAAWDANA